MTSLAVSGVDVWEFTLKTAIEADSLSYGKLLRTVGGNFRENI